MLKWFTIVFIVTALLMLVVIGDNERSTEFTKAHTDSISNGIIVDSTQICNTFHTGLNMWNTVCKWDYIYAAVVE